MKAVHNAISARVASYGLPVMWLNSGMQPPTEPEYLRLSIMPLTVRAPFVPVGAARRLRGLIEVSCYAQRGGGMGRAWEIADGVGSLFSRGTRLMVDNGEITFPVGAYSTDARVEGPRAAVSSHAEYEVLFHGD